MIRVYMSMTAVTTWIYTVKEINSSLNTLQNIGRCSYSHQISRFVLRKIRHYFIQNSVHFFMSLTNCKAAYRITVQIHLWDCFGMFDTDILINCSLVDSEQKLLFVDGIRQTVQPCHFCLATRKPACSSVHRFLYIVSVCHTARAFIKCHGNCGAEIRLDLHTLLRSHKNLMTVNMWIEVNTFFFNLS